MLRQHISLLVPLFGLLFGIESIILLQRTFSYQENSIRENYSIGITSKVELEIETIQERIIEAKELIKLETKDVVTKLTGNIKDKALNNISKQLPFFYSLKLEYFPDTSRLEVIENELLKIPNILRVNTFSKSHNENYIFLRFTHFSIVTFSILLLVISILLMSKQVEVWRYVRREKMEIMDIHGASAWVRNRSLFKIAFTQSLIASLIISVAVFYLSALEVTLIFLEGLKIDIGIFSLFDFFRLFVIGIFISFLTVFFVIISRSKT